jgi:putative toxin-antitoxin system antitoxin component (TIGR02293 family)
MKQLSRPSTTKPKNGGSEAASAALERTHLPLQVHRDPGKRILTDKRGQQADVFAAFAGSSVMAHDAVMKGVPGRALTRIWESTKGSLPAEAILKAIGVSARTAHRIKADPDKPLDVRTTDGIYRLESVRAIALEVLGSTQAANEWFNTEAMGLEYRKPIDLVSTSPGVEAVKTLLQRMKHGVYA